MGNLFKSVGPCKWDQAEVPCGLVRIRFKVNPICSRNSGHSSSGHSGSTPAKVAIKWFLYVLIARSALFLRCWPTGVISMVTFCFRNSFRTDSDIWLSSQRIFTSLSPLSVTTKKCSILKRCGPVMHARTATSTKWCVTKKSSHRSRP